MSIVVFFYLRECWLPSGLVWSGIQWIGDWSAGKVKIVIVLWTVGYGVVGYGVVGYGVVWYGVVWYLVIWWIEWWVTSSLKFLILLLFFLFFLYLMYSSITLLKILLRMFLIPKMQMHQSQHLHRLAHFHTFRIIPLRLIKLHYKNNYQNLLQLFNRQCIIRLVDGYHDDFLLQV